MVQLKRLYTLGIALLIAIALPLSVQGQTIVAEDNGDNYTDSYFGGNQGTGFNAWVQTEFGGDDQGGGNFLLTVDANSTAARVLHYLQTIMVRG